MFDLIQIRSWPFGRLHVDMFAYLATFAEFYRVSFLRDIGAPVTFRFDHCHPLCHKREHLFTLLFYLLFIAPPSSVTFATIFSACIVCASSVRSCVLARSRVYTALTHLYVYFGLLHRDVSVDVAAPFDSWVANKSHHFCIGFELEVLFSPNSMKRPCFVYDAHWLTGSAALQPIGKSFGSSRADFHSSSTFWFERRQLANTDWMVTTIATHTHASPVTSLSRSRAWFSSLDWSRRASRRTFDDRVNVTRQSVEPQPSQLTLFSFLFLYNRFVSCRHLSKVSLSDGHFRFVSTLLLLLLSLLVPVRTSSIYLDTAYLLCTCTPQW